MGILESNSGKPHNVHWNVSYEEYNFETHLVQAIQNQLRGDKMELKWKEKRTDMERKRNQKRNVSMEI